MTSDTTAPGPEVPAEVAPDTVAPEVPEVPAEVPTVPVEAPEVVPVPDPGDDPENVPDEMGDVELADAIDESDTATES